MFRLRIWNSPLFVSGKLITRAFILTVFVLTSSYDGGNVYWDTLSYSVRVGESEIVMGLYTVV